MSVIISNYDNSIVLNAVILQLEAMTAIRYQCAVISRIFQEKAKGGESSAAFDYR